VQFQRYASTGGWVDLVPPTSRVTHLTPAVRRSTDSGSGGIFCSLVPDLEAIRESQIGIGQRSATLLARHQLAGEEVTHTDIGNE